MSTTSTAGSSSCLLLPLQKICLLKLISDLESFSPDSLALLPLHFRHQLMCYLPAVDVCRLEHSNVVSGLDDMNKVWERLCSKQFEETYEWEAWCRRMHLAGPVPMDGFPAKDLYFSYICELILNYSQSICSHRMPPITFPILILALLFSVPMAAKEWGEACLGRAFVQWSSVCPLYDADRHYGKERVIPYRYIEQFKRMKCDGTEQAQLLIRRTLGETQYYPMVLRLGDRFFSGSHWKMWMNYKDLNLLKVYLSQVQRIRLEVDENDFTSSIPGFIMDILPLQSEFQHLRISAHHGSIFGDVLNMVSPHSVPETETQRQSLCAKSGKAMGISSGLCSKHGCSKVVRSIGVFMCAKHSTGTPDLVKIIESQPLLEKVSLGVYCRKERSETSKDSISASLCDAFTNIITRPAFCELSLRYCCLPHEVMQSFLQSLLSKRCSHEQKLYLCKVGIQPPGQASSLCFIDPPPCSLTYTSVEFEEVSFSAASLAWLKNCVVLSLKALSFIGITSHDMDILAFVLNELNLEVEELCLCACTAPASFAVSRPQGAFAILGSPYLKVLTLSAIGLGRSGYLTNLTAGLRRQVEVCGSLNTLDISYNQLSETPSGELQEFMEDIFSLPQLPNFTMDIGSNGFEEEHLKLVHQAWEKNSSGEKLKLIYGSWWGTWDVHALGILEDIALQYENKFHTPRLRFAQRSTRYRHGTGYYC